MTSRRPIPRLQRRAFTLVELLATIVVISTVAGVTSSILMEASKTYSRSAAHRRSLENAAMALDRIARVLREAPAKEAVPGAIDFIAATPSMLSLSDQTRVEFAAGTVALASTDGVAQTLCNDVSSFNLTYYDAAGSEADTSGGTDTVRRVGIRLTTGGVELRTSVWLRASLNE